jgi:hypothetical protein
MAAPFFIMVEGMTFGSIPTPWLKRLFHASGKLSEGLCEGFVDC